MTKILAVDIGNTRVKLAIMQEGEVIDFIALPSKSKTLEQELIALLKAKAEVLQGICSVLISSVVPKVNDIVKKCLQSLLKCPVHILTAATLLKDTNKSQLLSPCSVNTKTGMDILCKSVFLASKEESSLCLDSGTATVINYVDDKYNLVSASITLGYRAIFNALHNEAELLPLYEPDVAEKLLANNTKNSVYGGSYYGYLALINGLIQQAQKETGCKKIYFTGGFAFLFKDRVSFKYVYNPYMVFEGINLIYHSNINFFNNFE